MCFIDYSKTIDSVDHEKVWVVLEEMSVPQHLIVMMCNLYYEQEATVRTEHGGTEWQ